MIVRSSKFLLLFFAAILLGSALFAVVALWQLSRGPVSLGFLTPNIEDSLSSGPNDAQVRLHDTVLTWAGLERTLDLRAIGLEILDNDGEVAASVPELSVQFSLRALMRGLIAPTGLELFGPRLRVVRTSDGEIVVGMGAVSVNGQSGRGGMELIDGLLQEPDPNTSTGYLRRVSIVSALIEFEDRQAGRNWTTQRADISLERDNNGIRADGIIVLDTGGESARFELSGLFNSASEAVELGISFEKLAPVIVASLDPRLKPLERFNLPVSGTLTLSLTASLAVEGVNFDLTGDAGAIALPEFYRAPLEVTRLALRGRAAETLNSLVIDQALLGLDGPVATLSGTVTRQDNSIDMKLETKVEALPVDRLPRLWPASVGVNARAWITKNIKGGTINSAAFSLSAATKADDIDAIELREASGEFDLQGATVHYLRPMSPLRKVSGRGRFDGIDLAIDIPQGEVGALKVEAARVAIKGLTGPTPVEIANIEATIVGPARDALVLLDEEPLKFISSLGIDPSQTGGTQSTDVVFEFPLLNALTVDEVDVAATTRLKNFSAPGIAFGAAITRGDIELSATTQKLVAKGKAALSGIPIDLTWTENFSDGAAIRTRYEVQTVLDDGARQTLGLGDPLISGPVGVGLTYEIASDGAEQGAATLNLTDTVMSLADFGWQKAAGPQAAASLEFTGREGKLREITKFAVTAPALSAEGRLMFADNRDGLSVSQLDLARLVLGDSDVSLQVSFPDTGALEIVLGGAKLDARLFVVNAFSEDGGETPAMRLWIDTDNPVRSIRLGEETTLQNPSGRLVHDGENWSDVDLLGTLSNAGNIDLRLQSVEGRREVLLESDDGGGVLRALDWINTIEGGQLRVAGAFVGSGADEKFSGQLDLADFKLNESSVIVRIISAASFSGISDIVAGTGVSMRRAEIPFEVTDDEVTIGGAKARGAGLGIIGTGRIDRVSDRIELKGEIALANVINSILGNIPLVNILIGDGIFAVAFTVEGPLDDPNDSVNPLTVLVPGIFRKAFTGFGDGKGFEEGSTEQPTPPPPAE